jgi:GPI inositol-deacylase, winged helix domain
VLNYREPRKRLKALETVPKDMGSAYDEVMERIESSRSGDKELAMKILSWIFHAKRPLLMNELLEALVVEDGDLDLKREWMLEPCDVIESCKSLIIHKESNGSVQFIHFTVQEFIKHRIQQNLPSETDLSKTCLTYLSFAGLHDAKDSIKERLRKYKFSQYAARHWGLHTKGEPEMCPEIRRAIFRLLGSKSQRNSIVRIGRYRTRTDCQGQTLLHVLSKIGLATICSLVLRERPNGHEVYLLTVAIDIN